MSGEASAVPEDGTLAAARRAGGHWIRAGHTVPDLGRHVIVQRPPPFERYEVLTAAPQARTQGPSDHQALVGRVIVLLLVDLQDIWLVSNISAILSIGEGI